MINKTDKNANRIKRHFRVRNKVSGTSACPRLNVYRSLNGIYAQVIDDQKGITLASASTLDKEISEKSKELNKTEQAKLVGTVVAERAKAKGVEKLNQVLRGFGLVAIILFYLIAVELFFEPSLLGLIFTPKEFHAFWYFVQHTGEIINAINNETAIGAELIENQAWILAITESTTIFDDWLQWGVWFPVVLVTAIEVLITIGVVYIIAYSIRDIFSIVKNLIKSAKGTVVELGTVVKDNFEEETKEKKKKL